MGCCGINEKIIEKVIKENNLKKNSEDLMKLIKLLKINIKKEKIKKQISWKYDKKETVDKYLVDYLK